MMASKLTSVVIIPLCRRHLSPTLKPPVFLCTHNVKKTFSAFTKSTCNYTSPTASLSSSPSLPMSSSTSTSPPPPLSSSTSSSLSSSPSQLPSWCSSDDEEGAWAVLKESRVIEDFVSVTEETDMMEELEPVLRKMRYEYDHWDDAIHGYRETERSKWRPENQGVIDRIRDIITGHSGCQTLMLVHVLDLDQEGVIKPHVDSVRYCGDQIAGLSFLSDSVMRLKLEDRPDANPIDLLLKRRSLYVLRGDGRYKMTHEILSNNQSFFRGKQVNKGRRVSVICRDSPKRQEVKNDQDIDSFFKKFVN